MEIDSDFFTLRWTPLCFGGFARIPLHSILRFRPIYDECLDVAGTSPRTAVRLRHSSMPAGIADA